MVLEKEEVCWVGANREGKRNAAGICCVLLGFSSLFTTGRIAIDVDIAN